MPGSRPELGQYGNWVFLLVVFLHYCGASEIMLSILSHNPRPRDQEGSYENGAIRQALTRVSDGGYGSFAISTSGMGAGLYRSALAESSVNGPGNGSGESKRAF